MFSARMRFGRSRSSKVVNFDTNRKRVCDFLLVRHSNLGPIFHRFRDIAGFFVHDPSPIPPQYYFFLRSYFSDENISYKLSSCNPSVLYHAPIICLFLPSDILLLEVALFLSLCMYSLWNDLPSHITSSPSLRTFKQQQKCSYFVFSAPVLPFNCSSPLWALK